MGAIVKWYSTKAKPCIQALGYYVFGVKTCGVLTRNRVWSNRKLLPICKPCQDEYKEYLADLDEPLYDVEIGINENLYTERFNATYDRYEEVELSNCKFGCKIYENSRNGRRVLAHNSIYGCDVQ